MKQKDHFLRYSSGPFLASVSEWPLDGQKHYFTMVFMPQPGTPGEPLMFLTEHDLRSLRSVLDLALRAIDLTRDLNRQDEPRI